jgi:hypothetical protein
MYQLGISPVNQRLTACGQHAGSAMHTAAGRQRTSHVCGALLQQQHLQQQQWHVLQQTQALHTSCQPPSTALCALQQQQHAAGWQALPGHLLQTSRRYSKSWRRRAAARDSDVDAVTTIDKQQQQQQQQWQEPSGSSSRQQQQQQQQQQQGPPSSSAESSSAESSYDAVDSRSDLMRPSTQPVYSPLHYDVVEFARLVVPTPAERAEKQRVIQW